MVVHGDDFTCLGWNLQLDWFREKIKDRFGVKYRGRIGPGDKEGKEMRILNRIVTWTEEGIRYEGDQRHVEIGLEELGLLEGSRSVSTPGEKEKVTEEGERTLDREESRVYRGLVARLNYLAQDRSDIQYTRNVLQDMFSKLKGQG